MKKVLKMENLDGFIIFIINLFHFFIDAFIVENLLKIIARTQDFQCVQ